MELEERQHASGAGGAFTGAIKAIFGDGGHLEMLASKKSSIASLISKLMKASDSSGSSEETTELRGGRSRRQSRRQRRRERRRDRRAQRNEEEDEEEEEEEEEEGDGQCDCEKPRVAVNCCPPSSYLPCHLMHLFLLVVGVAAAATTTFTTAQNSHLNSLDGDVKTSTSTNYHCHHRHYRHTQHHSTLASLTFNTPRQCRSPRAALSGIQEAGLPKMLGGKRDARLPEPHGLRLHPITLQLLRL